MPSRFWDVSDGMDCAINNNMHIRVALDFRTQLLMASTEAFFLFQWLPGKPGRCVFHREWEERKCRWSRTDGFIKEHYVKGSKQI